MISSNGKAAIVTGAIGLGAVALAAAIVANRHPVGNPSVKRPTKPVDLDRYSGRWHEIARYDQSFERCLRAVTADYALTPDGTMAIVNTGIRPDGMAKAVHGTAKIVDRHTNARLKVSFFGPFYVGNYWVLDRADDYSWAIVGDPSGRFLWLLARKPHPEDTEIQDLVGRAQALGYDTAMLVMTGGQCTE